MGDALPEPGDPRLARELQEFVSRASHDLKSPASKVLAFARLLEADESDRMGPESRENLAYLIASAEGLVRVVDQLGDYACSAIAREGEREEVDLGECARRSLARLSARDQACVRVEVLPTVRGSRHDFELLLDNLLDNALTYRIEGELPQVVVRAERGTSGWRIEVTDQGIGIDAEHHDRVFLPFERLHGASRYPGVGLGLAICQRLAERNAGRIEVTSALGEGACFRLCLANDLSAGE